MTRLSVNVNKVATLRNSRGGNNPNVVEVALDCEKFGADGVTVHPRPDERHIRRDDVYDLKKAIKTELNIEGNPTRQFMDLVLDVKPEQVTLVPDSPDQITSNDGWDTVKNRIFLSDVIKEFRSSGIRVSIFVNPDKTIVEHAYYCGADRVELYTEPYARIYSKSPEMAVKDYVEAGEIAKKCGLGLNAGHDLSLFNLQYFCRQIPWLDEVSIGHALICDALYLGLRKTIDKYKQCIIQ
ncbi:MAG TPA: pyridoxine 5'-phosphate synthase [Bacteroidaceae bacterium]|nr:pyridoxine 5'-phosphate synthase [Bacteroidaceae bacterium]